MVFICLLKLYPPLFTPPPTYSLSVDSSKDLSVWVDRLSSSIQSALSCCQVALRLWEHPYNKVCGDCGAANPEWASVNLLLVICQHCAGMTAHLVHVKIINAEGCVTAE